MLRGRKMTENELHISIEVVNPDWEMVLAFLYKHRNHLDQIIGNFDTQRIDPGKYRLLMKLYCKECLEFSFLNRFKAPMISKELKNLNNDEE